MNKTRVVQALILAAALAPFRAMAHHQEGSADEWKERAEAGHYEQREALHWIPGRYERAWIPAGCAPAPTWRPFGPAMSCRRGHYGARWNPGHYAALRQWFWVPDVSIRSPRGF